MIPNVPKSSLFYYIYDMDTEKTDLDPFQAQIFKLRPFSKPQGVKNNHFFGEKSDKFTFTLQLHLEDGFRTWVKYIYSESPPYTLHKSLIR